MVGILFRFLQYRLSHPATSLPPEKKESLITLIDETKGTRHNRDMDLQVNGMECELEFLPIEHPIEPTDEDRPVKCPMSDSSIINDRRQMHEGRFSNGLWKRTEISAPINKERTVVMASEPPVRAVRKRHHRLTTSVDQTLTPLARMPPLHPVATQNLKVLQMLHHFSKFES